MEYIKNVRYIKQKVSRRALLELLAEEATELSQAALKLIRAEELSESPTNVSAPVADMHLKEEARDVYNSLLLLDMEKELVPDGYKLYRMAMRLKDKEEFIRRMAENDVD